MVLVCQVISKNHMIKLSHDSVNGSFSWQVTILPSLATIGIEVVGWIFVVEEQDSICCLPLWFISTGHGLKAHDVSY